jgi:hypothetical protein
MHGDISYEDLAEGRSEFMRWGAAALKNRTGISQRNIFDRMINFKQYHMKSRSGLHVLTRMMQSGNFYSISGWTRYESRQV